MRRQEMEEAGKCALGHVVSSRHGDAWRVYFISSHLAAISFSTYLLHTAGDPFRGFREDRLNHSGACGLRSLAFTRPRRAGRQHVFSSTLHPTSASSITLLSKNTSTGSCMTSESFKRCDTLECSPSTKPLASFRSAGPASRSPAGPAELAHPTSSTKVGHQMFETPSFDQRELQATEILQHGTGRKLKLLIAPAPSLHISFTA